MTLGEKIKTARKTVGLTQKQLGLACGYIESSAERIVQKWEHSSCAPPLDKIRTLATALKVSIDYLIP